MGKEASQNVPKLEWEGQTFRVSLSQRLVSVTLRRNYDLGRSGSLPRRESPKVAAVEGASNTSKSWVMRL